MQAAVNSALGSDGTDIVDRVMRRHAYLTSDRQNWESLYTQVAERVFPRADFFQQKTLTQGDLRTEKIFDSTAVIALERFASALQSLAVPRQNTWHLLKPPTEGMDGDRDVQIYLEEVNKRLFHARYRPSANFATQAFEVFMSLGAFGTGPIYVDEDKGRGLRYRALHLSEAFIGEDHAGRVDTVHRVFELTARQMLQAFDPKHVPEKARRAAEKGDEASKFEIVHCVSPNKERIAGRYDAAGMAWASYYVCASERCLLAEKGRDPIGGYRTMPYMVPRYVTGPRETYGRSPAMTALADIKGVNEMSKTMLRAGQLHVAPPLLLPDDDSMQAFNLRSHALNRGFMSADGRPLVGQLQPQGNLPIGLEMVEDRRRVINDSFLVTLFQILVDQPGNMTATEIMQRAQEKGQLLGPVIDRLQTELLGPLIEREIDILAMAGEFDDLEPPEILMEAGGELRIEYDAPINRLQRAEGAVAVLRTVEAIAPLAQIDPSVLDAIDPDEALKVLAHANGMPPKVMRSPEDIAALRDQRAQQQQAQQLIQALPAGAKAARDLAQAQAVAGNSPAAIPFVQPEGG